MVQKARNEDMVLATEGLKSLYDELVISGFSETQALDYISSFMAKTAIYNKVMKGENNGKR